MKEKKENVKDLSAYSSSLCQVEIFFSISRSLLLLYSSWRAACNGPNLVPFVRATGVLSITISVQKE